MILQKPKDSFDLKTGEDNRFQSNQLKNNQYSHQKDNWFYNKVLRWIYL